MRKENRITDVIHTCPKCKRKVTCQLGDAGIINAPTVLCVYDKTKMDNEYVWLHGEPNGELK